MRYLCSTICIAICVLTLTSCLEAQSSKFKNLKINDESFLVELAVSPQEWARGLMFRKHMGEREGMFFVGKETKLQSFWMKNTYLSLDIVFIDENLKIVHIARDTTPESEESIPSLVPARHILELLAGTTKSLKIDVGDQVVLGFELPTK